jgi:hypothetical protein
VVLIAGFVLLIFGYGRFDSPKETTSLTPGDK